MTCRCCSWCLDGLLNDFIFRFCISLIFLGNIDYCTLSSIVAHCLSQCMVYGPSFDSGYVLLSWLKCDVSLIDRCVKQESPSDFFDSFFAFRFAVLSLQCPSSSSMSMIIS